MEKYRSAGSVTIIIAITPVPHSAISIMIPVGAVIPVIVPAIPVVVAIIPVPAVAVVVMIVAVPVATIILVAIEIIVTISIV